MAMVTIDKVINLTQLGQELTTITGQTDLGFRMTWDGTAGRVRVLRGGITNAALQSAVNTHIAAPVTSPEPTPQEIRLAMLRTKLDDNTATFDEVKELLRLERV